MIRFPVLDHISVRNYALYIGSPTKPGLQHDFHSGVNVIVGINGLGKTTLLNILLRSFTGPFDSPQGEELGDKKRRLVPADRAWFRRRVPDDAVDARATVIFRIGERVFELERSLANLDLVAFSIDQQPFPAMRPAELEAIYQREVTTAAGLSSFDDFVFLLRYVVFFLEDRRTLVWDPAAQGDILGILFGEDDADRRRYVEVFNDLLSKDSEYRNMHAVVSKRRKEFNKQASGIEGGQLEMLEKQLTEKKDAVKKLSEKKSELTDRRNSLREQIENRRLDIHDQRASLATDMNNFYESFFPQIEDTARYLLSHFEIESGCLVCGSNSPQAIAAVNAKLEMNICPLCSSPIEHGAQPAHDPHAGEAIEQLRADVAHSEAQLRAMLSSLTDVDEDYALTAAELLKATSEASYLGLQQAAIGDSLPDAMARRASMQQHLLAFEDALNQIEVERSKLADEFRDIAAGIDQNVQGVSARIVASFTKFISGFLAETCQISYTARQSRIGQRTSTESFPFPQFIPALTSGVHRLNATAREQGQSVSESQKEFIDLAFRMALLEVAAPDAPSMLILETPEASLDSVFVPRAADLLRRFAVRSGGARDTRLIASSNINREQMIPALFGAYPDERFHGQVVDETEEPSPPRVPIENRARHVLDLLSIAAPTKALDRFRAAYEEERERALYPERFSVPS